MKYALLIGIDYIGTKIESAANTHDVLRIRELLVEYDDVITMTDNLPNESPYYPNHENIMRELNKFIRADTDGHYLFVFCGCSRDRYDKIKDEDGERLDSKTKVVSAILPRGPNTQVIDSNDLRRALIDNLPESSSLSCIFSANFGHQLLPTRYNYNFKKGAFRGDCDVDSGINKNVVSVSFSTDEFNPVVMQLTAQDKPTLVGTMGVFALTSLTEECNKFEGEITREGYLQVLLKKLVANNPTKHKTYNLFSVGGEDAQVRLSNFYIF